MTKREQLTIIIRSNAKPFSRLHKRIPETEEMTRIATTLAQALLPEDRNIAMRRNAGENIRRYCLNCANRSALNTISGGWLEAAAKEESVRRDFVNAVSKHIGRKFNASQESTDDQ